MNDSRDTQKMTIGASVDNLEQVAEFVDRLLNAQGCPAKVRRQIVLAVEEIFVNIAYYAYGVEGGGAEIRVKAEDDAAEVTITDEGTRYNPLDRDPPDLTLSAEERPVGGLGIYLVCRLMDDIHYVRQDGHNILTIRKNWN